MGYIFKDYFIVNDTLYKFGIDDKKHLLWKFGGVPTIDVENVWDKHKDQIRKIRFRTKRGYFFKIDAETFDKHKQKIDFGYGQQYYVDRDKWDISLPYDMNSNEPMSFGEILEGFGGTEVVDK